MQDKEEITMKNYIKPTAQVVELSVKESLSTLPEGVTFGGFEKRQAVLAATTYNVVLSQLKKS